jgi:hypothetical protein
MIGIIILLLLDTVFQFFCQTQLREEKLLRLVAVIQMNVAHCRRYENTVAFENGLWCQTEITLILITITHWS